MKYILFGASNPETLRVVNAVEKEAIIAMQPFTLLGFLDNDREKHGKDFYGYPIFGGYEKVRELAQDDVRFVNLITGSTLARQKVTSEIRAAGGVLGNLIHPSVNLEGAKIGVGAYIQEAVILQSGVEIGENSSLHMGALVGHESLIGNTVFIAHAVSISGCCEIGDGSFIGTNATVLPRVKIGKWCIIGAGAVVNKDVPDYTVVAGNPAKTLREITPFPA